MVLPLLHLEVLRGSIEGNVPGSSSVDRAVLSGDVCGKEVSLPVPFWDGNRPVRL